MSFHQNRRQQFLGEEGFNVADRVLAQMIQELEANYLDNAKYPASQMRLSMSIARDMFNRLVLHFTAGQAIEPLRGQLEFVVCAFERHSVHLWEVNGNRNEPVFEFDVLDDYCQLMQLVGLCFLLHRRDLLPRIAAMQDGVDATGRKGEGLGGSDWNFEEFMSLAIGPEHRYESDNIHWAKPYEALADALSSADNDAAFKDLDRFLKHWYKDLAGTGWHDSHKPNEKGEQGGYYGYWSFEAGAAVLLLGIEDDSRLHKYLYYPKDMVAWAREHAALSVAGENAAARLRAAAGEPCPREGFWTTPARTSARQHFTLGQVMPDVGGDYGTTLWQWDDAQTP